MTKLDQSTSKEFKIKRFHSDEIRLILFICATDLNKYDFDDLEIFAESIEGRIEVLLTPEYLKSITGFIRVDNSSMSKIQDLKIMLQSQYSSQWYKKMTNSDWKEIIKLSREILEQLNIEYQEPLTFMENNLDVDWT
jgi:hypothetical protein